MIDMEIILSPGFIILSAIALGATALGFLMSVKSGWASFPLWQLILIMGGELVICYVYVAKS